MNREAVVKIIDQYLCAFESGNFSEVQFSSKMQFISPIREEPVVGNDTIRGFLTDVSSRIAAVTIREHIIDYPKASSLFEFKTTKGDVFIFLDYFEFDEEGISLIWPCLDPKLLIADSQRLPQFLTGENY
ncbi:conserved hypothetical protein [Rippkaea orientalis PCC 8801]|uniref:DUF4904 domain-containing protein n=1 Tax=Rippkaea orientalis (strain PCC 8801 / RF-1) TaxID=41431 RepID=B7JXD2_RIPO1|nr:DUF4904 domain-containing protein [Rippkaea orientalis]ACK67120.1 conserved hypothetical protein [Rippkaea orientalis PCC 8801]